MQAATLRENRYRPRAVHRFVEVGPSRDALERTKGSSFPLRSSSRSMSDDEHLSSFSFDPQVIDSIFVLEQAIRVHQYLQRNSSLFPLLLRARAETHWLFGALADVKLRMEDDPEGEFAPRLLVTIQTNLDAKRAIDLLDLLDDRWWLSISSRSRSLMKIDVEYV
jgi:hypothetical protein